MLYMFLFFPLSCLPGLLINTQAYCQNKKICKLWELNDIHKQKIVFIIDIPILSHLRGIKYINE